MLIDFSHGWVYGTVAESMSSRARGLWRLGARLEGMNIRARICRLKWLAALEGVLFCCRSPTRPRGL